MAGFDGAVEMTKERYPAVIRAALILIFTIWGCSSPQPTFEEQGLMDSLEAIAVVANSPGNGQQFNLQLDAIQQQITAVKQMEATDTCFIAAIDRCHSAYVLAGRAWERRLAATDVNRIADFEQTYNFSLSFASLSLEQAKDCYNNP